MARRKEVGALERIPHLSDDFAALLAQLFPPQGFAGVTCRLLTPPNSPAVTVAYLNDVVHAGDLERIVLPPLEKGGLSGGPAEFAQSGRFPASHLQVTSDPQVLQKALLTGLTALHADGHAAVLLLAGAGHKRQPAAFGSHLSSNVGLLVRLLASPDVRVESCQDEIGNKIVVLYLATAASPDLVAAVKCWSVEQRPVLRTKWHWKDLLFLLRVPPALSRSTPMMAADSLRRGYVAILSSAEPVAQLAPTTIELALSGPRDAAMSAAMRRLLFGFRLMLATTGQLAAAWLVAVSGYHHSLIPGPFLVALAASRQNAPFPITMEIFGLAIMDDLTVLLGMQLRGEQGLVLALIAIILAVMVGVEVGIISPISGVFSIVAVVTRLAVPSSDVRHLLRAWRFLFMAAAAGLGVYGLTLAYFVLLVYLGGEHFFGHPVHEPMRKECS